MSNSKVKDEPGPDKSAAKRATDQQSQDAIRHHEDASHHKGTQHGGADGSTRQQTLDSSKGADAIAPVTLERPAGNHPKGNETRHKGGPSK
jgi:hypothetical protein